MLKPLVFCTGFAISVAAWAAGSSCSVPSWVPACGSTGGVNTTTCTTSTSSTTAAANVSSGVQATIQTQTIRSGESLSVSSQPGHGSASVTGGGASVAYTSSAGYSGSDSVTTQFVSIDYNCQTIEIGSFVIGKNLVVNTNTETRTISLSVSGSQNLAPSVTTLSATSITPTTAVLNSTVNANGASTTVLSIKYDTSQATVTSGGGTAASVSPSQATGSSDTSVSASLNGLASATTYYFRASATNANGTTSGSVASFTTARSSFVVTYDANGASAGTAPSSQSKDYGADLSLASNSGSLRRTGYRFSGWNTAADGSGTSYPEGATYSLNADLALYANWAFASAAPVPALSAWASGALPFVLLGIAGWRLRRKSNV